MQILCLKPTDLYLIIHAKNSVVRVVAGGVGVGWGGGVEGLILFGFFSPLFFLIIFLKSLVSNNILLAIQMLRFSVFHIIKLDN